MKKDITTIKISKKVVGELSKLKIHSRQSYEEVIVRVLGFYNAGSRHDEFEMGGLMGKKEITTIKISKNVVEELSKLKIHPRQSYEEVIVKVLGFYKKGKK